MVSNKVYGSIIKNYKSKIEAYDDTDSMLKLGYKWFSGWYTSEGFYVEYRKYGKG